MSAKHTDAAETPWENPARAAFVAWMTVFGNGQQLLKDQMRIASVDDLGPLHMRLLSLCLESPGLTQQQLANLTCRDKGQVAHLIHALEKLDLVVRTADANDGRLWRMSVTAAGAESARRFMGIEATVARQLFASLSADEVDQLHALASRILEGREESSR